MDIESYVKLCTESISQSAIMAGFVGVRAQDRGETTWLSAVSHDTSLLNLDEVSLGSGVYSISKPALMNAQKQDPIIGRVLIFKETGKWPST